MYFNPQSESFKVAINSPVYVDKTLLLEALNMVLRTEGRCVSLSHARRFGKSQAAGMIDAYYNKAMDSRELFAPFKIAKCADFEKHLNKYNVIHLDISTVADFYKEDLIEQVTKNVYGDMRESFPDVDYDAPINKVLSDIYSLTGTPFVIIIDEWDCVVRNHADRPDLVHRYMQFLHAMFKSEESKSFLALGYITGILPVKKIKDESALNNFVEYTMVNSRNLTEFYGFTEDEVKDLCEKHDLNFESVRKWYNGYLINGKHMYNPNSVYQAIQFKSIESYWKNTSSFDTINTFITMNFDGLKDDIISIMKGGKVYVDTTTFLNDLSEIGSKDNALTALIHLGYLGYDADRGMAYMPNYEVSEAFQLAIKTGGWKELADALKNSLLLLNATIDGEEEKVAEYIELAHEAWTSVLKYNDENSLASTILMAYYSSQAYYDIIRELPTGKGFADLTSLPRKEANGRPAILVELKWDKDADSALRQIHERHYAGELQSYSDEIVLVGINYDKKTKRHACKIERYRK